MIFKTLDLKNWTAYKKASIEFSTDKKKNVTLFRGKNYSGKTSLMRAIRWALYGDTGDFSIYKKPLDILNKDSFANEEYDLSVKLVIEKDSKNIELIRSLKPKTGVTKPSNNDFEENFSILEDGKAVLGDNDKYIQKEFDKEISDFFIFDGEKLQEYQNLTNNPKKSQKLQSTIEKLIRRPYLKAALHDLQIHQQSIRNKIKGNSNDKLLDAIASKLEVITDLKNMKSGNLEILNENLKGEEENLKIAKSKRDAYGTKNENVARLSEIEGAIPEIENNIFKYKNQLKELHESSWLKIIGMAASCSNNSVSKNFSSLKELNTENSNAAAMISIMQRSIDKDLCMLCEKEPLGNEQKKAFLSKIEALKKEIPQTTSDLSIDKLIFQIENNIKNKDLGKLEKSTEDLLEEKLKLSSLAIEKEDLEITVGKEKGAVAQAQSAVDDLFEEIGILKQDIEKETAELKGPNANGKDDYYNHEGIEKAEIQLQEQYDSLLDKQPSSKEKTHLDEVNKLVAVFKDSIEDLSNTLKSEVELEANKIFKKLMSSDDLNYNLEINENFGLIFKTGEVQMETSAAGNLFVALALINALKNSTGIKGPMMIDTPLGRVDLDGRERVLNEFPKMSEQCILLVHSGEITEGSDLDKTLSSSVGKYFEIKQLSETESTIISK